MPNSGKSNTLVSGSPTHSYITTAAGGPRALLSPEGTFSLMMGTDGSVQVISGALSPAGPVWSPGVVPPDGAQRPFFFGVRDSGDVALFDASGEVFWSNGMEGAGRGPYRLVHWQGRLWEYDSSAALLWSSPELEAAVEGPVEAPPAEELPPPAAARE